MSIPVQGDVGTQFFIRGNEDLAGPRVSPATVALADGGYFVSWLLSDQNVYGQYLNAAGVEVGPEFKIGTSRVEDAYLREEAQLRVEQLEGGNIVVGWVTRTQSAAAGLNNTEVAQVIIDGTTKMPGAQSLMNTTTAGFQSPPDIVALSNGGYFATWFDGFNTTSTGSVKGQYFNADGSKNGSELTIGTSPVAANVWDTYTYGNMPRLDVIEMTNGNVVVGWMAATTPSTSAVNVVIDSTTKTPGTQTTMNSISDGDISGPEMTALPGGGYFAAWVGDSFSNSSRGIYGQYFNADGTKNGGIIGITTANTEAESYALTNHIMATTLLADGNIAVAWTVDNSRLADGVQANEVATTIVNSTTKTAATPTLVNSVNGEYSPVITAIPDGRYFMAWMENTGYGLKGQYYNADGTPHGANLDLGTWMVNDLPFYPQAFEAITLANGDVSVTWTTKGGSSGIANIIVQSNAVVCFAAGTQIKTISGDVRVETLEAGDLVLTADHGYQEILWIGKTRLSPRQLGGTPNLVPIRIPAGALGNGLPTEPLLVSPQHRVLVRSELVEEMTGAAEVLVAAKHLVGTAGIHIARDVTEVEYWHFLFAQHEVVFANGAPSESLFTGAEALKSVSSAARVEILALFPELAKMDHDELLNRAARPIIKGRIGRDLALRHKEDHQPLLAQSANH